MRGFFGGLVLGGFLVTVAFVMTDRSTPKLDAFDIGVTDAIDCTVTCLDGSVHRRTAGEGEVFTVLACTDRRGK
jgi:hypothetical protein